MQILKGRKTYLIVILMIVYAISGLLIGKIDVNSAIQLILSSLAVAGLRIGIANK